MIARQSVPHLVRSEYSIRQPRQPAISAEPQGALPVLQNDFYPFPGQAVSGRVIAANAVRVFDDPFIRAEPHISLTILIYRIDFIGATQSNDTFPVRKCL